MTISKVQLAGAIRAHEEAFNDALELFAFSSSLQPMEWHARITNLLIPKIVEFAAHARRVQELLSLPEFRITECARKVKWLNYEPEMVNVFRFALNRILHAKFLQIQFVLANEKEQIFAKSSGTYFPGFVISETDERPISSISLSGLALLYMSDVSNEVDRRVRAASAELGIPL